MGNYIPTKARQHLY